MHLEMAATLDNQFERRGQRTVVIGPRGGAKSTIGTLFYATRKAVEGSEPYIMLVSDIESQAIENLSNIKLELEDNAALNSDYPHATGAGPIWRENYIKMRNGTVIHAVGTGTKIRGRRVRQDRPSLIIGDDLENDSHISSALERLRVETWFNRTLLNMGDSRTNVLVLGSALHRDSLLMKLLRRPGWIVRRKNGKPSPYQSIEHWPLNQKLWDAWEKIFNNPDDPKAESKALKFYQENKVAMDAGAVLCWPDREPLYSLMKLRAEIGPAAFDAEKQGNPINPASCEWPESYLSHDKLYFDEWPDDLIIRGQALDPSKGKGDKRNDFSALAFGGVSRDGIVYVDLDMRKRPVDEIIRDWVLCYSDFRPDVCAVESNQFQSLLCEDIQEASDEAGLTDVNIQPLENFTSKAVRIRRLSTLLSRKRIRFKAGSEGAALCIQQMKDFPNGDHDDGPDAVEMLCRILFSALEESLEDEAAPIIKRFIETFQ